MKAITADGLKIDYNVRGSGPRILLLHGFGNNQSMWNSSGWAPRLQDQFTVITLDFRGCGESEKPEGPSAYSIERHLQDIEVVTGGSDTSLLVWGWSLGATVALHLSTKGKVAATVSAGTYFGPIFTEKYIESRIVKASAIDRARLRGMATWPHVQPDQVKGRLLMYTGTNDGNVVKQLELQRSAIEMAGGELVVLSDISHTELVTATEKVGSIVWPFLYADR